jgi:hypothetical protein
MSHILILICVSPAFFIPVVVGLLVRAAKKKEDERYERGN